MSLVTGVAYPLVITLIAQITMQRQANGDFLTHQGKIAGSRLIAQKFESDKYFWPRPSAVDYNPLPSGGSNLGPTSETLKKAVEERRAKIAKAHDVDAKEIPSELLFASGSGLDPDITPSTAYFQIKRIVKARGIDLESGSAALKKLIDDQTTQSRLRIFGEPYVNVLVLNNALEELTQRLDSK